MKIPDILTIRDEYSKTEVEPNPHFAKTQDELLSLIDLYSNSKYREGSEDESGYKRAFLNIVDNPTMVACKMIDLDTKDIRIIAEDGQSYYPAWLFSKDLKHWMKEQKFGKTINDWVYNYPKYGHLLVKKTKDGVVRVPLQNVSNDPEAGCILESEYIIEEHLYLPAQLREMGWDKDKVEEAILKYEELGKIPVYEVSNINKEYKIIAGDKDDGVVLFSDEIDRKDFLKELKWEDVPGRALGRGLVEKLFEEQIAVNKNENFFSQALRWTSKRVFQTRDESAGSNLLTDVENGDLIFAQSEITTIPMEERNLAAYNYADSKWKYNAQQKSFSTDVVRGEKTPGETPLGSTQLAMAMTAGYFDLKREDLGMFIDEILTDWIIPDFKKNAKKTHKIMLGEFNEDELEIVRNLIVKNRFNKAVLENIKKTKRIPSRQERELLRGIVLEEVKTAKDLEIPKNYYDNIKYKVQTVITGENMDIAAKLTTLQTVLQIIGSNPTLFRDKRAKKVFYQMLNYAGINPVEYEVLEENDEIEDIAGTLRAERGGSIARTPSVSGMTKFNQQATV
jgi:hypothetical protein